MGNSKNPKLCAGCTPVNPPTGKTEIGVYLQEPGKEAIGAGVAAKNDLSFWALIGILFYLLYSLFGKKKKTTTRSANTEPGVGMFIQRIPYHDTEPKKLCSPCKID